jgi:hypothetical protein
LENMVRETLLYTLLVYAYYFFFNLYINMLPTLPGFKHPPLLV